MKIGELIEKIKNDQKTANTKQVYRLYQVYHSDISSCNNNRNNGTPNSTPNGTALLPMYETTLEDIAAKYEAGGLNWLSAKNPELYAAIEKAEDGLNEVWNQCLEYKASIDNFKRSLHKWYELQIEGIEYHRSNIN